MDGADLGLGLADGLPDAVGHPARLVRGEDPEGLDADDDGLVLVNDVEHGALHLFQRLLQVGQDVLHVLDAHGQADEVGGDPGGHQLCVGHLPVGGGGGVQARRCWASATWVAMAASFSPAHEGLGGLAPALDAEGHHAAGAVGHVLLGQLVILVPLQAGVVAPRRPWGGCFRYSATVRALAQCWVMRRCRVSSPTIQADRRSWGAWMEPKSRMSWAVALVMKAPPRPKRSV